jgi:two-component system, chemotaxis family, sensor kinase CheA
MIMDAKKKEFLTRLRATFRIEAEEHIKAISAGLMDLEKNCGKEKLPEVIETIFRGAHSLKGAARSVDLRDVEALCQPLEGAFSAIKRGKIELTPSMCDLFHKTVNAISSLISSTDKGGTAADRSNVQELIKQLAYVSLEAALPGEPEGPDKILKTATVEYTLDAPSSREDQRDTRMHDADKHVRMETVRIPTSRLDPVLLQAEEMILIKMAAGKRVGELKEIDRTLASLKAESAKWKEWPSATETRHGEQLPVLNETSLNTLQGRMTAVTQAEEQDFRTIKRMVDEHLESMKLVMMLPVATLVEVFPKLIRDLARDQEKEAELFIGGSEIEIDKRILEELKDPFIHILRNCIDHGIKKPEERALLNKTPKGKIDLIFGIKDGSRLEILVSDDGEGIDAKQVRAAAIKSGLTAKDAAGKLSDLEVLSFIFKSGVTTSPIITDISGRGLGLAIVCEKVEKLGGSVSVETHAGLGTIFRLIMPLTLATFRGIQVRVDEHVFILPTLNVERAVRLRQDEIRTVENRETIGLNGQILSLVRLGDVLELPVHNNAAANNIFVLVIVSGDTRIAFQVDEVLDEQQVFVKSLGRQLVRVRNIAGATVLGSGRVVPILNIPDLIKSAVRSVAAVRPVEAVKKEIAKTIKILVVEDSITSRTLIRNILETAGYRVATAVDGVDAFTQVRSGEFDLVVSDVDMPRMNGFELTNKIRNDKKLGELPVILVTALESREDRERGIDVGANAYIVKSSFDQSNLLEVIKRLI